MDFNGWKRFRPLTDDPEKLKRIGEILREIGKDDAVFLLRYLALNPDINWNMPAQVRQAQT